MSQAPLLIVVMGPSGCGKSTLASALAETAGGVMVEADDYHPPANKAKMAAGTPLSDRDRMAWLDALTAAIRESGMPLIWLACSALTPYVQKRLRDETSRKETQRRVQFVLLEVPKHTLRERMLARSGHYMPASLLDSQMDALNVPNDALRFSADQPLSVLRERVLRALATDLDEDSDKQGDRKAD